MKNILNNRFIVIAIITVMLITTLSTSVFAADTINFTYNDTFYSVPDVSSFITSKCDIALIYVKDDVPILHISSSSRHGSDIIYPFFRGTLFAYNSKIYKLVDGKWSYLSGDNDEISNYITVFPEMVVYCNVDLYDDNGNVVFPVAPQIPEITKTLVEQTTQTQIQEQLKLMITGFLKYLIVFVISVIAFWKGWKFLSKQLKRA